MGRHQHVNEAVSSPDTVIGTAVSRVASRLSVLARGVAAKRSPSAFWTPMTSAAALASSMLVLGLAVVPFAPVQGIDTNGAQLAVSTQSLDVDLLGAATLRDSFSAAAAPEPPPAAVAAAPPMYTGGGSPAEWMAAAGIPESDWGYVDAIISRESGWNPNATNSSSGACGLAQAYPCEKLPNAYDPVVNLTWANGYANGRYGSWAGAYAFWQANKWW